MLAVIPLVVRSQKPRYEANLCPVGFDCQACTAILIAFYTVRLLVMRPKTNKQKPSRIFYYV